VIPFCYESVLAAVRTKLLSRGVDISRWVYRIENSVALTSDLWTDLTLRAFICLTASWIDENWVMQSELVNVYNCTDRHTGDNLCGWVVGLLRDMGLDVSLFDH
jgi:hypothetical protein